MYFGLCGGDRQYLLVNLLWFLMNLSDDTVPQAIELWLEHHSSTASAEDISLRRELSDELQETMTELVNEIKVSEVEFDLTDLLQSYITL